MPPKILLFLFIIQFFLFPSLFSQTGEQLRANLYSFNTDSSLSLDDGNLTMYNINNSNAIDGMDAVKMANFGENFGLSRGNTTLAIERRQTITTSDTIFFRMWNMHKKSYKLVLLPAGLSQSGLIAILEDLYLNTRAELTLDGANSAVFSVTNDMASSAPDRFRMILLSPSSFKALPVSFTGIKAYRETSGEQGNIDIEWGAENEKDIAQYQVEKSINGQHFFTLYTIYPDDKNAGHYRWIDSSSITGNNFYRIKGINADGGMYYSDIVNVSLAFFPSFSVFPNPVINGSINLRMTDQPKGVYIMRLVNKNGQVVHSSQVTHTGGSSLQTIQVNNINKGNYILEIVAPGNKTVSRTILLQ